MLELSCLEVADSEIRRRLSRPYLLVIRSAKQELATRVDMYPDKLQGRQRAYLNGLIEWGVRGNGLLEIRRAYFIKYNKPVYFQEREFKDVLRNAKLIIVPTRQKPDFLSKIKDYLKRNSASVPKVLPVCDSCLRENRLTILTKKNAVKLSETHIACITCAQAELKMDLATLGFDLSRAMITQLQQQLTRIKSVPRMLQMLAPDFDPASNPDLTLVERIATGKVIECRRIGDLPLPKDLQDLLRSEGYDMLLPVQEMVIDAGLFKGEDLLVVSSTSSGKTLIAELAGVPKAMHGQKMIYLAPLVALTNEKYELFRHRYRRLGLRTGIKVGMSRLDVGNEGKVIVDTDITKSDIICATYEALDMILRSGEVGQIGKVGTIIVDEIQNLADPERGPELDGLMVRLRYHFSKAQVLALSATVGSPEKLADELNMRLVNFVGRPVPLEKHLVFARNDEDKKNIILHLVRDEFQHVSSFGNRGQSIIFTFSRRRAQGLADWLYEHGVSSAVYHGGLSYNQRRRIERAYEKQRYACVVTTAALGAGVDLPASQVIFESLAMGADWLSTAEFEQMLGRAGRLGKHDRGKVYLIVQPGRKYHGGQEKYEDEVAIELLKGVVEVVEPFADTETCAEQILATICSTGLSDLKAITRLYRKMISASIPPSDALKFLVRHHMIRVREGGAHPTSLGKATSLSFLTPSQGIAVLQLAKQMDFLDIAVKLEPFENVYLSSRLQSEIDSAFKTHMPTRIFSGVFSDITNMKDPKSGATKLPKWVFKVMSKWLSTFFNCKCKDFPECDHGKIALGRWIAERRREGLNPTGISKRLHEEFELWAYPGDILSWLDTLIHHLNAVKRIVTVGGMTDLSEEIEDQIARLERPRDRKTSEKTK